MSSQDRVTKASKWMSFVLRHNASKMGLEMDTEGWVEVDDLLALARNDNGLRRIGFDEALLNEAVETNNKKRFSFSDDGRRIRAVQGHSMKEVTLNYEPRQPPSILYHGTATRFLDSIRATGLAKMSRHHVHLSENVETSTAVGRRYGTPVILVVDTAAMSEKGIPFFIADNGVWLTDSVPPEYIRFP